MTFQKGDIVRIKGGRDEWEVVVVDGEYYDCRSCFFQNEISICLNDYEMELVRRKEN